MEHPGFLECTGPFSPPDIAGAVGAAVMAGSNFNLELAAMRPLAAAAGDRAILNNRKYLDRLSGTKARQTPGSADPIHKD